MADLSLANAIGISEKAPDYTQQYLRIGDNFMRQRAAKKQKNDEDFQKFYSDIHIDPSKYHRILVPEVQKEAAQTWGKIMDMHQQDPNNYKWGAIDAIQGLQNKLMQYQALSKNYNDFEKTPVNQDTQPQSEARKVLNSGTWNDLKQLPPDKLGSFAVGQDASLNRGWIVDKSKNDEGELQKNLEPLFEQSPPEMQIGKDTRVEGKLYREYTPKRVIPEQLAASKAADYWITNPSLQTKVIEENRGDLEKGFVKMPDGTQQSVMGANGQIDDNLVHSLLLEKWAKNAYAGKLTKYGTTELKSPDAPKEGETEQGASWVKQPSKEIPTGVNGAFTDVTGTYHATPVQSVNHYSITLPPSTEGKTTFNVKNGVDLETGKPITGDLSAVRNEIQVGHTVINGKEGNYAFITVPREVKEKETVKTDNGLETRYVTKTDYDNPKTVAVPYDQQAGKIESLTSNKKNGQHGFNYNRLEPQYSQGQRQVETNSSATLKSTGQKKIKGF